MIMVHQPVHPYQAAEGWVAYHAAIADAVPDLGVVLYVRSERVTGGQIRALGERSPNVIGVKYGVKDATQFAAVARDAGLDRFTWLAGLAEPYAPGYWAYGARGFTSGLANVSPSLSLSLLGALRAGDAAGVMDTWELIRPFEDLRAAGRVRGQRIGGQGSPGPAGPVRPGRAAAEPPAAGRRAGPGADHPAILGRARA